MKTFPPTLIPLMEQAGQATFDLQAEKGISFLFFFFCYFSNNLKHPM